MSSDCIILVDSREKKPLPLPSYIVHHGREGRKTLKVHAVRTELSTGDYALQNHKDAVLVERKSGLREICSNLGRGDRTRFLACIDRLASACRRPVLMMEGDPYHLGRQSQQEPDLLRGLDELQRLLMDRRIELLLLPTGGMIHRRAAGEWVCRLLLNGAEGVPDDAAPVPTDDPRTDESR